MQIIIHYSYIPQLPRDHVRIWTTKSIPDSDQCIIEICNCFEIQANEMLSKLTYPAAQKTKI